MIRNAFGALAFLVTLGAAPVSAQQASVAAPPDAFGATFAQRLILPGGACLRQPAVWVARDADTTIFLFGTLHLRRPGAVWGGPVAEWALKQADLVWTELSPGEASDPSVVQTLGTDQRKRLSQNSEITTANKARLRAAAPKLGIPFENFDVMKPWLASITLSVAPMLRAGYDPEYGVDNAVQRIAIAQGKNMRGFETSKEQLSLFDRLSPELQLELLTQSLDEFEKSPDALRRLEASWEEGDDVLMKRDLVDDVRAGSEELYEVLLKARNTRWANVLDGELDSHAGVQFVAVGVAHLIGADSVVTQLQAMGRTVDRITPGPRSANICQ